MLFSTQQQLSHGRQLIILMDGTIVEQNKDHLMKKLRVNKRKGQLTEKLIMHGNDHAIGNM